MDWGGTSTPSVKTTYIPIIVYAFRTQRQFGRETDAVLGRLCEQRLDSPGVRFNEVVITYPYWPSHPLEGHNDRAEMVHTIHRIVGFLKRLLHLFSMWS